MTIACKWKAVDYAAAAAVSEQVNFRTACERQEWVTWTTVMIMEKKHDRKIYARPRIHYIVGGVRFLVLAKYGDGVDSTKDSR